MRQNVKNHPPATKIGGASPPRGGAGHANFFVSDGRLENFPIQVLSDRL